MQRSVIVAGVSALLLLGTAGPALAAPSVNLVAAAPAQVSVVPVGAAATGDGSMAELEDLVETDAPVSVSSSVLWWSGGGLGVALAAVVAGRRPSPRR